MVEIDIQILWVIAAACAGIGGQWFSNRKTVQTLEKKIEDIEAFNRDSNREYNNLHTELKVLATNVSTMTGTVRDLVAEMRELRKK